MKELPADSQNKIWGGNGSLISYLEQTENNLSIILRPQWDCYTALCILLLLNIYRLKTVFESRSLC